MKMPHIPNIGGIMKVGKTFIMANRPEILFGASITATLAGVVLAAKGGYEARGVVEREESRRANTIVAGKVAALPPLTTKEKAQLTWQCYMPAAVMTIGALGSTTGLHIVHVKEKKMMAQAALAAIEELKTSAKEFEKETLGVLSNEEKTKILEERADKTGGTAMLQNTDGEIEELYLVRDPITGRDIWSNKTRMEAAIVEMGNLINASDCASVNNFYEQAGWGRTDAGEDLGWSGVLPEVRWNDPNGQPIAGIRDDGRPWRGFRFLPTPEKGFDDHNR